MLPQAEAVVVVRGASSANGRPDVDGGVQQYNKRTEQKFHKTT